VSAFSQLGPHLLSAIQVHTTTHCRFYREQQLGHAPPKIDPGYGYLITNLHFVFKYTQKTHTNLVFILNGYLTTFLAPYIAGLTSVLTVTKQASWLYNVWFVPHQS